MVFRTSLLTCHNRLIYGAGLYDDINFQIPLLVIHRPISSGLSKKYLQVVHIEQ